MASERAGASGCFRAHPSILARNPAESRIAVTGSCPVGSRPRCFRDFMRKKLAVGQPDPGGEAARQPHVRQPFGAMSVPAQWEDWAFAAPHLAVWRVGRHRRCRSVRAGGRAHRRSAGSGWSDRCPAGCRGAHARHSRPETSIRKSGEPVTALMHHRNGAGTPAQTAPGALGPRRGSSAPAYFFRCRRRREPSELYAPNHLK